METIKKSPTNSKQSQNYISNNDDLDEIIKAKEQNERESELKSRAIHYSFYKRQNINSEIISKKFSIFKDKNQL